MLKCGLVAQCQVWIIYLQRVAGGVDGVELLLHSFAQGLDKLRAALVVFYVFLFVVFVVCFCCSPRRELRLQRCNRSNTLWYDRCSRKVIEKSCAGLLQILTAIAYPHVACSDDVPGTSAFGGASLSFV